MYYTKQEARHILKCAADTLDDWLDRAGMNAPEDEGDRRKRKLSWEQLKFLAAQHNRILPAEPPPPSADPLTALEARLSAQLAAERREREKLARRVEQLEQRVADNEQPTVKIPAVRIQEVAQPALPSQPARMPALPSQPVESLPVAPASQTGITNRYLAVAFLTRHGASYGVVSKWKWHLPLPDERQLLAQARERQQRLKRCAERCQFCQGLPE